jgi:PRTRC genetic system protein B
MEYIKDKSESELEFVLCGYSNKMIYHDYNYADDKLSAGKLLTTETAKSIFNFVNGIEGMQSYGFNDILSQNILKYKTDEKYVVWFTEPGLKTVLYAKKLSVKTGVYWVPRLLWKLEGNQLYVFAIKKLVSKKDKLYNAPLFNISSNGSVCMGNTKFTDSGYDYQKIINKVELGFWGSVFTHTNNNKLLDTNFTEWCNDSVACLNSCNNLLVDSGMTIQNIL